MAESSTPFEHARETLSGYYDHGIRNDAVDLDADARQLVIDLGHLIGEFHAARATSGFREPAPEGGDLAESIADLRKTLTDPQYPSDSITACVSTVDLERALDALDAHRCAPALSVATPPQEGEEQEPYLHRNQCVKARCASDCPRRHEPAVLADRLDRLADESDSHSDDDALRAAGRALRDATPAPAVEVTPADDYASDEAFEFVAFAGGSDPANAAIVQSFGMDRAAAEEHARWLVEGGVAWRRDPEATAGPWGLIDGWQDPDGDSWVVDTSNPTTIADGATR